jgi:hypothetical protein
MHYRVRDFVGCASDQITLFLFIENIPCTQIFYEYRILQMCEALNILIFVPTGLEP